MGGVHKWDNNGNTMVNNGNIVVNDENMVGFHNGGTPKWMVYFMENAMKMDDLGVLLFQEPTISKFQFIPMKCDPIKKDRSNHLGITSSQNIPNKAVPMCTML